ncbi:MAG: lipopolysaccharide biosynthesis protein [Actinobacteria bacterium]|nr:lipopolysaccharide biosynthesis protein [Actinomycetota bacterium]
MPTVAPGNDWERRSRRRPSRLGGRWSAVQGLSLARETAWAGVIEGTQLVSSLAAFYVLTTELRAASYGLYAGLQAIAAILATLSSASVLMFILQEVIRERRTIAEVLPVSLTLAVAGGVMMTGAAGLFGPFLLRSLSWELITAFMAAEVIAASGVNVAVGVVQASSGFAPAARMRAIYLIVRLASILALWAGGSLSLVSLTTTLLVVNAFAGAVALVYVSRTFGAPLRLGRVPVADVRRGLSHAGVLAGFAVQEDSDKTLMVRFAPVVDAGVYAAGYRAVQLAMLPVKALLFASHNRFLLVEQGARAQHLRRAARFTVAAVTYACLAGCFLFVAAPVVADVLGRQYENAADVVRLLAPLVVLRALSLFAFNGLLGLGRIGVRVAAMWAGAAVNLAGNLVLIPHHSWRGAAAATILAEATFAVISWSALVFYQSREDASTSDVTVSRA